jgi:hypothetical protein
MILKTVWRNTAIRLWPVIVFSLAPSALLAAPSNAGEIENGIESPIIPIIDSVIIETENVFDLSIPSYDNFLFRLANKTHIVTRHSVIRRELLLGKGDAFDTSLVNESIRNLRSLPFLFKTEIELKRGEAGENIMVVSTSDKWTTTAGISYHRTGGRNDLQFSLEENNFLGYGVFLSNQYTILDRDRNFYQVEMTDRRFLGNNISVGAFYSDNPQAGQIMTAVARPYYSLKQRWSGEIRYSNLRRRLDYYVSEILVAQDRFVEDRLKLEFSYRFGPNHWKYYLIPIYEYLDLEAKGLNLYDPEAASNLPPPTQDSLVHFFKYTFRAHQVKFAVYNRLNRFQKPEDVNLGLDARLNYGHAFGPGLNEILYHYFSYWGQFNGSLGSNLFQIGFFQRQWVKDRARIREDINGYFKWYSRYHNNHTLVVGGAFYSIHLSDKSYTLYLDEDNGLRGYPAYIFNGEDRLIINIENRYFSDLEILSIGIGGAAFADIGNIWARDGRPTMENTHYSFGAGLRFGISRSTSGEVIRFDLAYAPKRKTWQISVGTGQFF